MGTLRLVHLNKQLRCGNLRATTAIYSLLGGRLLCPSYGLRMFFPPVGNLAYRHLRAGRVAAFLMLNLTQSDPIRDGRSKAHHIY